MQKVNHENDSKIHKDYRNEFICICLQTVSLQSSEQM